MYFLGITHSSEIIDNDTVQGNSTNTWHTQHTTMMFLVPKLDEEADNNEVALSAIDKMNQMIQTLINKLPSIRIGPWTTTMSRIFIQELQKKSMKVDFVEYYVHDYTRHISAGARGCCCLNLYFPATVNVHMISSITSAFRKPRIQFLNSPTRQL